MNFPDVDTLRLCSILASTAFGFVFWVLWLRNRQALHLACWAMSSLLYGGAILSFALLPRGSLFAEALLYAVLGITDTLPLVGVLLLDGKRPLRTWMVVPALSAAICHLLPSSLAIQGVISRAEAWQTVGDAVGLIIAMGAPGFALAFGAAARQSAGRRMAGLAMLAYLPAYVLSIAGAFVVLPGTELVALLAMLSDQLLLGILNLALLAIPAEQRYRELSDAACRDALTGCWNRQGLATIAAHFLDPGAAVIALDVDHFKQINDRYGHAAGDEVLSCIGREALALAALCAGEVVRTGGDEFLILLPARSQAPTHFSRELRERLAASQAAGPAWRVSLGFAAVLQSDQVLAEPIARADAALYQCKAERQPLRAAA